MSGVYLFFLGFTATTAGVAFAWILLARLGIVAPLIDDDPHPEPAYDRLAERRESFDRDLTRVHQLDTYQPNDWGGDTA